MQKDPISNAAQIHVPLMQKNTNIFNLAKSFFGPIDHAELVLNIQLKYIISLTLGVMKGMDDYTSIALKKNISG